MPRHADERKIGGMLTTQRSRSSRARTAGLLLGTALAATALAAPAAHAESIVFIKDANVWLAAPDGSALTRVTTDGTTDDPYRSPSQADDGTIAAAKGSDIVRLRQNGEELSRIDPPTLTNSVSHPIDGAVVDLAISPDGSKIAYQYASYTCPVAASCGARTATGITDATRASPASAYATTYLADPEWVGNGRLVVGGGYGSHAVLVDAAAGSPVSHWFDDEDYFGESSDLGMTAVSADGTRVASIHGYDSDSGSNMRLIWFRSDVDVRTAPLPVARPAALCVSSVEPGLADPTWSPAGDGLAWTQPDGLHRATIVPRTESSCGELAESLVVPGATEPDWGPAAVNPGPRSVPAGGGSGQPGPGAPAAGGGATGPGGAPGSSSASAIALKGKRPTLSAAIKSGVRVRITGLPASTRVTVQLRIDAATARRAGLGGRARTIARAKVRTSSAGAASVTLRIPRTTARALRRAKIVKATVRVAGAPDLKITLR